MEWKTWKREQYMNGYMTTNMSIKLNSSVLLYTYRKFTPEPSTAMALVGVFALVKATPSKCVPCSFHPRTTDTGSLPFASDPPIH